MRWTAIPSSLVAQLTAWYSVLSFFTVCLATGYLYWSIQSTLSYESERTLSNRLETIRLLCLDQPFDLGRLRSRIEREWPITQAGSFYVQMTAPDGTYIAQTPSIPPEVLEIFSRPLPAPSQSSSSLGGRFDLRQNYKVIVDTLSSPAFPGNPVTVRIALDYRFERRLLLGYRRKLVWTLLAALIFCSMIGRRIARRGVAPIHAISRVAANITSASLHSRLNAEGYPIEMAVLTQTFNAMLDRLEGSFSRLARFSADIAHELKTPISNITGEIEVTLTKPRPASEYTEVLGSNLEECGHITRIIDSLLFLAQCENPQTEVKKEKLNLQTEVRNIAEFYDAAASDQQLQLKLNAVANGWVAVEKTLFQRAIGNLIDNALKQTAAGGSIEVSVHTDPSKGVAEVQVRDTGRGIAADHLPFVFDRFYRVDDSRSKDSGGTGLGLALVKSIAIIHGGSVSIDSSLGVGTTVFFRLPLVNQ